MLVAINYEADFREENILMPAKIVNFKFTIAVVKKNNDPIVATPH